MVVEQAMLVGKCPKCGKQYIGWALSIPEYQVCPVCGARLVIRNMHKNCQPDEKTLAASEIDGMVEWQESLENNLSHFLL